MLLIPGSRLNDGLCMLIASLNTATTHKSATSPATTTGAAETFVCRFVAGDREPETLVVPDGGACRAGHVWQFVVSPAAPVTLRVTAWMSLLLVLASIPAWVAQPFRRLYAWSYAVRRFAARANPQPGRVLPQARAVAEDILERVTPSVR